MLGAGTAMPEAAALASRLIERALDATRHADRPGGGGAARGEPVDRLLDCRGSGLEIGEHGPGQ